MLSVASAGLAELGAQGAEAGRIGITAARVAGIIRDLISAAKGVCATIGRAVTRVIEVSRKLKVLLGARLSRATTQAVAKLPDEAKTAEELAESRLLEAKPNNRGLDASELNQTGHGRAQHSAVLQRRDGSTGHTTIRRFTMQADTWTRWHPVPDPTQAVPARWRGSCRATLRGNERRLGTS